MISVGVDVSKGKSTICILKPYGEIMCSPFEVQHEERALEAFTDLLNKLDGEIRIVMEATGIYHLPVLTFLHDKGYFVSVINPFALKKHAKDNERIYEYRTYGTQKEQKKQCQQGNCQAIINEYQPQNAEEMQDALKDIFGPMFEAML